MFSPKRPSDEQIADFLARQASSALTYEPIGLSSQSPKGFNIDDHRVLIGSGAECFERARAAIDSWAPFFLPWVEFHPDRSSPEVGTNVAIVVRHLGFWSMNGCRVVGRFPDGPTDRRAGFFYGTLEDHAESGEELFTVDLDPTHDSVSYHIRAVSRPRAMLAKLGYPISRRLQRKFRDDSAKAILREVGTRTG